MSLQAPDKVWVGDERHGRHLIDEDDYLICAERVTDGAETWDEVDPEWFWVVDPDRLWMGSGLFQPHWASDCGCIVSQHHPQHRYGHDTIRDYGAAFRGVESELGLITEQHDYYPHLPVRLIGASSQAIYAALTELYIEAIEDRRAAWLARHPNRRGYSRKAS